MACGVILYTATPPTREATLMGKFFRSDLVKGGRASWLLTRTSVPQPAFSRCCEFHAFSPFRPRDHLVIGGDLRRGRSPSRRTVTGPLPDPEGGPVTVRGDRLRPRR